MKEKKSFFFLKTPSIQILNAYLNFGFNSTDLYYY